MAHEFRIGGRGIRKIMRASFSRCHYRALIGMMRVYTHPGEMLGRYLFGLGGYPCQVCLHTPVGLVSAKLWSHSDVLTVNEIFCRLDYPAGSDVRIVVDLGSNIGLSALYFLTRNKESRCYLFEPVVRNQLRLRENLAGYEDRYLLSDVAVANINGDVEFGVEETGRYGGIGVTTGTNIKVSCRHVNEVLADVLRIEPLIDILKIDTEGQEVRTIEAIDNSLLRRIKRIYAELGRGERLQPLPGFRMEFDGTTWKLFSIDMEKANSREAKTTAI
jgi:FkbM family methyltransferase